MGNSDLQPPDLATVRRNVQAALSEDVGSGDITAALIPADTEAEARVISREHGILCGTAWVNAVFSELNPATSLQWQRQDGEAIQEGEAVLTLAGSARDLLTGERSALNFLQLLSGTATLCRHYADMVSGTGVKLLDTRKTLPGLREAQKFAVRCGGCHNHRMGLYDAFLVKENHIAACGGIPEAIAAARQRAPGKLLEVEVENLEELEVALAAACDRIMLDNFSLEDVGVAVDLANGKVPLEVSGNVQENRLLSLARTGVDYISIGALTKHCRALDLSMRLA
ncbi:MAG: carboxylating nicotinate-nucleotide diphosphorylase [Halioglobus sp.]|nr:carboxylating nicotinate-nucleotide diphosphorylase [Halioglobus sp.]